MMARLRTIKPGFFTDDELGECDPLARLLFSGLWVIADREGRLEDRPKRIKAEVQPYDSSDVDALLNELARRGFIVRYQVAGTRYIAIPTWHKHQNPHIKEAESTIPAPPIPGRHDVRLSSIEGKNSESTVQAPDKHSSFPAGLVIGLESCLGSGEGETAPDADAPTPPEPVSISKVSRGNVRVAAVIDALRAAGMTGVLTGRDKKALKETECDPQEVAALYAAIYRGEHGDAYMLQNLSVTLCLEKMPGWKSRQDGHTAPAKQNGRPSRAADLSAASTEIARRLEDASQHARAGRDLPAVHPQLRGLPS